MLPHRSAVASHLTIVLAPILKRQLEGAHRARVEARAAGLHQYRVVRNSERGQRNESRIETPAACQQTAEVLQVHRSSQTLADELCVLEPRDGQATIGEHIGEVQFPARLEHPENLAE